MFDEQFSRERALGLCWPGGFTRRVQQLIFDLLQREPNIMRLGALLGPVLDTGSNELADQARALEEAGYESLWSAQAIGRGFMITDPLIALAVAAAVTERVELGTAIMQLPLYHPTDLAHRVLSLQQVAGPRLLLGVGAGSTEKDFDAFERDFGTRFSEFNESLVELEVALETGANATAELSPWPSVAGGPPVYYGTWGAGVERAAKEFSGWIASAHYRTPEELETALHRYREACGDEAGRAVVSTIQLPASRPLDEVAELLGRFEEMGFDDAVVMFLPGGVTPEQVRGLVQ